MHLTFTINDQSLVAGDCGSLVYITADGTDSPERIVGMFFGTLKGKSQVHQAVILSKALQQVGESEPFQGAMLKPFQPESHSRVLDDSAYFSRPPTELELTIFENDEQF